MSQKNTAIEAQKKTSKKHSNMNEIDIRREFDEYVAALPPAPECYIQVVQVNGKKYFHYDSDGIQFKSSNSITFWRQFMKVRPYNFSTNLSFSSRKLANLMLKTATTYFSINNTINDSRDFLRTTKIKNDLLN